MITMAISKIRRTFWELFFYLHQIVIPCLLVLFLYHSHSFVYFATLPLVLYVLDKLLRWFSIYSKRCSIQSIRCYNDLLLVEIDVQHRFGGPVNYPDLVGAVVYLRVPRAKLFEYHPVSLAFNEGSRFFFYIKVVGSQRSWTHRLASLAGQTGLRAYLEGPYAMARRNGEAANPGKAISDAYGDNMLVVAGGSGFAGVSSFLRDFVRLARRLPEAEQRRKRLCVALVMPQPQQLECVAAPLREARAASFCRVELFVTFRGAAEAKPAAKTGTVGDAEGGEALEFAVGRPELAKLLEELPRERLEVFYCGPQALGKSLFKALEARGAPFAFHAEVFSMWVVC